MIIVCEQISHWMNPILCAALIGAILVRRKDHGLVFFILSAASIAIAAMLAETGKEHVVLHGDPTFPSGHQTFATATLACLVWRDRRWLLAAVPAAALMGCSLVGAHYHLPIDVVGATVLGPIPPSIFIGIWQTRLLHATRDVVS
jgi:membrane-associated phospholipid phosphatase